MWIDLLWVKETLTIQTQNKVFTTIPKFTGAVMATTLLFLLQYRTWEDGVHRGVVYNLMTYSPTFPAGFWTIAPVRPCEVKAVRVILGGRGSCRKQAFQCIDLFFSCWQTICFSTLKSQRKSSNDPTQHRRKFKFEECSVFTARLIYWYLKQRIKQKKRFLLHDIFQYQILQTRWRTAFESLV